MLNYAFYDEQKRCLVGHHRIRMHRSEAALLSMDMGLALLSGQCEFPSRLLVVWDKPKDLGVFPLDAVSFGPGPGIDPVEPPVHLLPTQELFEDIRACVLKMAA